MLYVLWLIICGLGIWLVFRIRTNLVESVFFKINPWQLRALDRYVLYGLGAIWIVGIFLLEGLLRNAMQKGRLVFFAGRLLLIGLALIGVTYLITFAI